MRHQHCARSGAADVWGASYPFPYTDVASVLAPFCPGIMEAYITGVSKGVSPTTFDPNADVTRVQMTTFLQRSLDQGLVRASRRVALNQWWAPENTNAMQTITVGGIPQFCISDGENIWTTTFAEVVEIQASTGKVLGTWTGAASSEGVVVAAGKVFVAGGTAPGSLYVIDPTQPPGAITTAASTLGNYPVGIAFDGTNIWTANLGTGAGVSIIPPVSPYTPTTVTTGLTSAWGILYDGANIWVTDYSAGKLLRLNASGAILQTVIVGANPSTPAFDGSNIWVPNYGSNSITVVQASTGNVVATITGDATNMLSEPFVAAFDGERILVTNYNNGMVSVFKAADLSLIQAAATGLSSNPQGACSNGINFWVDLNTSTELLRF